MSKYGNKYTFVTAESGEKAKERFKELGWRIPQDFHELNLEEVIK